VEAVLEWDAEHKQWMARPLWETLRRLDGEEIARATAK
jgi:hypothetical protein